MRKVGNRKSKLNLNVAWQNDTMFNRSLTAWLILTIEQQQTVYYGLTHFLSHFFSNKEKSLFSLLNYKFWNENDRLWSNINFNDYEVVLIDIKLNDTQSRVVFFFLFSLSLSCQLAPRGTAEVLMRPRHAIVSHARFVASYTFSPAHDFMLCHDITWLDDLCHDGLPLTLGWFFSLLL